MEEPKIVINTTMSKEDYKKFLYISTFRKNKYIIPLIFFITLILSFILSFNDGNVKIIDLMIWWVSSSLLLIAIIIIKINIIYTRRVKTDKTGTFDSINTLKFYDDRIVMENKLLKSTAELNYNQFYSLMESHEYFVFYLTSNQASIINKRDINNLGEFKEFIVLKFENKFKKI